MTQRTSPVPPFPWWSLLPSVLLLGLMVAWGIAVYPQLPEYIPKHIGPDGVTAFWDKSPVTVFLVVSVFAGMTALFAGCAVGILRQTPADELKPATDRWVAAERAMDTHRPASAASALRVAKATLACNALVGVGLLPPLAVTWRTSGDYASGGGVMALTLLPIAAGVGVVSFAAWRDHAERKAASAD